MQELKVKSLSLSRTSLESQENKNASINAIPMLWKVDDSKTHLQALSWLMRWQPSIHFVSWRMQFVVFFTHELRYNVIIPRSSHVPACSRIHIVWGVNEWHQAGRTCMLPLGSKKTLVYGRMQVCLIHKYSIWLVVIVTESYLNWTEGSMLSAIKQIFNPW